METSNDYIEEEENKTSNIDSVLEDLPGSWTSIAQGPKNISNTINLLLNTYEPQDGINAYERALKTLVLLSKGYDHNTLQKLISLIPLPKGASDDAIKSAIHKSTVPAAPCVSPHYNILPKEQFNLQECSKDNNLYNISSHPHECDRRCHATVGCKNTSDNVPPIPKVFRGFPPNEISTVRSHIKNVHNMCDIVDHSPSCLQLSTNVKGNVATEPPSQQSESLKLQTNVKYNSSEVASSSYKSNPYQMSTTYQPGIFKSLHGKPIQIPVAKVNNYTRYELADATKLLCQSGTCSERMFYSKVMTNKFDADGTFNLETKYDDCAKKFGVPQSHPQFAHAKFEAKKYNADIIIEKKNTLCVDTLKRFEQEIKIKRQAIQDDINKMDSVYWDENSLTIHTELNGTEKDCCILENLEVHERLRSSLRNFLKRVEGEVTAATTSSSQKESLETYSKSSCRVSPISSQNSATSRSNLEKDIQSGHLHNATTNSLTVEKCEEKKDSPKSASTKTVSLKNYSKIVRSDTGSTQAVENFSESAPGKIKTVTNYKKINDVETLRYNRSMIDRAKEKNTSVQQQATSITELATYKKQYYDTLLSIQKAKVAVANSLAMPSVESSTRYDPYYSSYLYHHHQHHHQQQQQQHQPPLRQEGQLTMSPQFAVHTVTQSGLSNMHSVPYTWVGYNNWRHPLVRQLGFQQQSPSTYSRNKNRMPRYTGTMNVQQYMQDRNEHAKQCVQRKKLEEIVGKLKETENGNVNNSEVFTDLGKV